MNAPDWFDRNDKESVQKFLQMTNTLKGYFLLEGMPIDKNIRVMDFIANSEFELNNFGVSNYGYELDYNCVDKKNRVSFKNRWLVVT